jgi:hypothetical protein
MAESNNSGPAFANLAPSLTERMNAAIYRANATDRQEPMLTLFPDSSSPDSPDQPPAG